MPLTRKKALLWTQLQLSFNYEVEKRKRTDGRKQSEGVMKKDFGGYSGKIARLFARKSGISIRFTGLGAKTDGKTIYLPGNTEEIVKTPHGRVKIDGLLDHEWLHIYFDGVDREAGRKTVFDYAKEGKDGRYKMLLNVWDDVRIETNAPWAGVQANLRASNIAVIKELVTRPDARKATFTNFGKGLILKAYGLDTKFLAKEIREKLDNPDIRTLIEKGKRAKTSTDVHNLALETLQVLKEQEGKDVKDTEATKECCEHGDEGEDPEKRENTEENEIEHEEIEGEETEGEETEETEGEETEETEGEGTEETEGEETEGTEETEGEGTEETEGEETEGTEETEGEETEGTEGEETEGEETEEIEETEGEETEGTEGEETEGEGTEETEGEETEGEGTEGEGTEETEGEETEGEGTEGEGTEETEGEETEETEGEETEETEGEETEETEGEEAEGKSYDESDFPEFGNDEVTPDDILSGERGESIERTAREIQAHSDTRRHLAPPSVEAEDRVETLYDDGAIEAAYFKAGVSQKASVLKNKLVTVLMAKRTNRIQGDHDQGKIDSRALAGVKTGARNIFTQRVQGDSMTTAVMLLVDCSGSMGANKMRLAAQSAYVFGEALDALGVDFAVYGWTNRSHGSYDTDKQYNRLEPYTFFEVKAYTEKFKKVAKRFSTLARKASCNNDDGGALRWAARKLAERPADRHVMIVLSDGAPASGCHDYDLLCQDLHVAVQEITAAGIELSGLGIASPAVRDYYPNSEVVNSIEGLPVAVLKTIKAAMEKTQRKGR